MLIYHIFLQRNGFFIEAGALNGEKGSNSLSLETDLGWSGLLAEGDPLNIELVKYVNYFQMNSLPAVRHLYAFTDQSTASATCCRTASPSPPK